jgi:putative membrane protein
MKRIGNGVLGTVGALALTTLTNLPAWAQTAAETGGRSRAPLGEDVLRTVLFGVIGIALAIVGFKVFDLVIKHNIEQEIFENKNMAAALLAGAVLIGVSIIVAATIAF